MEEIPKIKRAVLVAQLMVKVDSETDREIRMLKAEHSVDFQEMIRIYLRKEIPRVKKRLATA